LISFSFCVSLIADVDLSVSKRSSLVC